MTLEELIKQGDLDGALEAAKNAVKADPAKAEARIGLFQLQCVLGEWQKAHSQMEVLKELTADTELLATIFGPVIESEVVRADVFSGKTTPIIFGEPEDWMGKLVHANQLAANGEYLAAETLRGEAFEAAPMTPGTINDEPFEWIADADPRLGPMLEVIMDGCYRWVPFCRISSIQTEEPNDLRDLVWTAARFVWSNGGTATGFIPSRYPGTEVDPEAAFRLSRKTDWNEKPGNLFMGRGQRELATDQKEYPLLTVRTISLGSEDAAPTEQEEVGQDG